MIKREIDDYLADMLEAAREAVSFTAGMDFPAFAADRKTVNAVIRSLEVLGEAAKKIPEDLRARHGGVPWELMAGMRDKLIHHYFGVDLEMVWETVRRDLPELVPHLEELQKKGFSSGA